MRVESTGASAEPGPRRRLRNPLTRLLRRPSELDEPTGRRGLLLSEPALIDGEPDPHDDPHSRAVASRIERAVSGDSLYAAYQPIVNLRTGRVVGMEAFVRFRDGSGVSPLDRFEEAQAMGLRRELELAALL